MAIQKMKLGEVLEIYREMYGDSYPDNFECCGNEHLEKLCCDERNLGELSEEERLGKKGMNIHIW